MNARSRRGVIGGAAAFALALASAGVKKPAYRGRLLQAEILTCRPASAMKAEALADWDGRVAAVKDAPRPGWREGFDRMAAADPGVLVLLRESRYRAVYESRSLWSRGALSARSWTDGGPDRVYFARGGCGAFPAGKTDAFLVVGETSKAWPPDVLPNFLGLETLKPVPPAAADLAEAP